MTESSTRLCRACRETIDSHASKCPKCQSYQNWRRYLDVGNSALALLVALASIVTLGGPPFIKAISSMLPVKEKIVVGIISSKPENFKIFAFNDGTAFGVLNAEAKLVVSRRGGSTKNESLTITTGVKGSIDDFVIEPKERRIYFVTHMSRWKNSVLKNPNELTNCQIEYAITGPTNEKRSQAITFECPN